ncbi:Phosphoglucosamine mutase [Planctomyces sp. SH-PL62]|nr:Phosphoglucosamine mutase [Planctomyces sp. SH-PL62]
MKGTRIASVSGIRGWVGDGLDPAAALEFAAAYASQCEPGAIVLSHDGRLTAPVFEAAVAAGIAGVGREVWKVGATATPTVGVLVRERGAAGGVQISASHNPPEYNGLKFFQPAGMVLSPESGRGVLDRWQRKDFAWAPFDGLGRIRELDDPDAVHLERVLGVVDVDAIRARKFTVALDACHGSGGRLAKVLLERLGCRAIVLGGEPDGRYDHTPEPTAKNLADFARLVPAVGAAVGFAQDPDADRLALVDEQGRYIGEELTLALAAARRLEQATGPVVLNLSTSMTTEALARERGCPVIRTPVGEIHVVQAMLANGAVIGGEGNGGVIDPRVGLVRDSFVGMALTLDLLASGPASKPLSAWVDGLPRFAMVKDQSPLPPGLGPDAIAGLWDRIAAANQGAEADRRDGLRLTWKDRWVHVRASNTEPIVRVIAEAAEPADARALADRVGRQVTGGEDRS